MFLRLIVRFAVVKRVCLVLCFKPFKIPFSVSCGLYRDNERNKKTDLSCCKIQPGEIPRFRCLLQSAPRACFGVRAVVILHPGKTRPRKPQRKIFETSSKASPPRLFPIARWERAVPLSDKLSFVRQRCSLCEVGCSPQSNAFLTQNYGY